MADLKILQQRHSALSSGNAAKEERRFETLIRQDRMQELSDNVFFSTGMTSAAKPRTENSHGFI